MTTTRPQRVNAADVLPADLVAQLQQHVSAVYVWVPSTRGVASRRRAGRVVRLRAERHTIRAIALEVRLTERRVQQILQAYREAGQP